MFTFLSANARQILPSVPGLSSIERLNSLTVGIFSTLPYFSILGCRVGYIRGWIWGLGEHHTPRHRPFQGAKSREFGMFAAHPNSCTPRSARLIVKLEERF